MLDDLNVISQRDPGGALGVAASQWEQTVYDTRVQQGSHDDRELTKVVVSGMGGSAVAAGLAEVWLERQLKVPFEIVRGYDLPEYTDKNTLVIACSYSGDNEETISCLGQARKRSAQIGVVASGGKLIDLAIKHSIAYVAVPGGYRSRMATIYMLRGLIALLVEFGIISQTAQDEIAATGEWLKKESSAWVPRISTAKNEAKQLALLAVGKTPVFYGGALTAPLAYKWKLSWNKTAKNMAFTNQYPEFNHNEFVGWVSHPVEKPFVVFDLISKQEHPQILKRFKLSDKLLSGKRPKAQVVKLRGDTLLRQLLWGCVLADFAATYTAILNGVDPTPIELIEKLKKELA